MINAFFEYAVGLRLHKKTYKWWRRLWWSLASVTVAAIALEGVAAVRMRRVRNKRVLLGDKLFVEVRGAEADGEAGPIVFLAGIPGTTRYWQHGFDPLARDHRLLFVDALGFGRSPWPDCEYTLEDHLGALRQTLAAADATRRVRLVGHSFGAVLAAWYAARYPTEIEHLDLLGIPLFHGEWDARRRIGATSVKGGLFALNPLIGRETCKLHEAFAPLMTRVIPRILYKLPPDLARESLLHTWQSYHGSLVHVLLRKPAEIPLALLGSKVTFIQGREDRVTPMERVRTLAARIGARIVETDDDHESYSFRDPRPIVAEIGRP